jgi:hypothetical protein
MNTVKDIYLTKYFSNYFHRWIPRQDAQLNRLLQFSLLDGVIFPKRIVGNALYGCETWENKLIQKILGTKSLEVWRMLYVTCV